MADDDSHLKSTIRDLGELKVDHPNVRVGCSNRLPSVVAWDLINRKIIGIRALEDYLAFRVSNHEKLPKTSFPQFFRNKGFRSFEIYFLQISQFRINEDGSCCSELLVYK